MPYGHQKEQTETTVFQPHQLGSNSSTIIVNIMYKMVYIGIYTILCLYCVYICILWREWKNQRRVSKKERRIENACSVLFVAWISCIVFVIYHASTVTYNAMRASQAFYTVFISFSSWCSYSSLHFNPLNYLLLHCRSLSVSCPLPYLLSHSHSAPLSARIL